MRRLTLLVGITISLGACGGSTDENDRGAGGTPSSGGYAGCSGGYYQCGNGCCVYPMGGTGGDVSVGGGTGGVVYGGTGGAPVGGTGGLGVGGCAGGSHSCDGVCESIGDPDHCGPGCEPCPTDPTGTYSVVCREYQCAIECGGSISYCPTGPGITAIGCGMWGSGGADSYGCRATACAAGYARTNEQNGCLATP
jgi:hypothetical protein